MEVSEIGSSGMTGISTTSDTQLNLHVMVCLEEIQSLPMGKELWSTTPES